MYFEMDSMTYIWEYCPSFKGFDNQLSLWQPFDIAFNKSDRLYFNSGLLCASSEIA